MTSRMLTETRDLLQRDKGNWYVTAAETGLGREWIAKLAQGVIKEPSVNRVERLHDYLTEKYQPCH